ncbi:uncharacterized protein ACBT44_019199, partial [Syngnathus typhle]
MSGVDQLKTKEFWRAVGGEFLAMLLFVFLGVGSIIDWESAPSNSNSTASQSDRTKHISLCFGLSSATMVQCFGPISGGGHINPAVTLAMVVTRKVTIIKGVFYLLAQLVGAVAGAGIAHLAAPPYFRENLGVTGLGKNVSGGFGLLVELVLTFQLVFTIFALCDPKRTDLGGSTALAIGVSVWIGHLFGVSIPHPNIIPLTGASMNPARSFGPSVIATNFKDHWVYWVGPFLGAIMAALLYEHIFCPSSGEPSPGTMSGVEQLKTKVFWRAVGVEFVATLLFVLFGVWSTIDWASAPSNSNSTASRPTQSDRTVLISQCFGMSIAMLVLCFGPISGGHINPAVTLAMVVTRKVTIIKGVFYLLAQLVGAVAGAGIVRLATPPDFRENLGVTGLGKNVSGGFGLLVELVLTFQLVFTIFASCDPKRTDLGGSTALAIGVSVSIGHFAGIPFTGASMNPARSFGPAVIATNFKDHWVYWVGPFLGAIIAALLYEHIFCPSSGKPSPGQVIPMEQMGAFKDEMGSMQPVKRTMSGVDQLKTKEFWRAVGGEFVAMLLFVFLGVGSTIDWESAPSDSKSIASCPTQSDRTNLISLCFALSSATMVQCFGHISGGHIN